MAVTANWFRQALKLALNKEIDFDTDVIRCMLTTSSYTPNLDTHDYVDDVDNEVAGAGYVAEGAALANAAVTYTAAASLTAWQASTAYVVGDLVRKATTNGHVYRCIVAGTSDSGEPTWPTVGGQTVADNTVTWAECGAGVIKLDADDVSWASSTITARYAVIYVDTGTTSTSALIVLINFGEDKSSSNGTFQITFDADGIAYIPVD